MISLPVVMALRFHKICKTMNELLQLGLDFLVHQFIFFVEHTPGSGHHQAAVEPRLRTQGS